VAQALKRRVRQQTKKTNSEQTNKRQATRTTGGTTSTTRTRNAEPSQIKTNSNVTIFHHRKIQRTAILADKKTQGKSLLDFCVLAKCHTQSTVSNNKQTAENFNTPQTHKTRNNSQKTILRAILL
jgi:hypothetical protein